MKTPQLHWAQHWNQWCSEAPRKNHENPLKNPVKNPTKHLGTSSIPLKKKDQHRQYLSGHAHLLGRTAWRCIPRNLSKTRQHLTIRTSPTELQIQDLVFCSCLGKHHLVSSLSWVFGVSFEIQKFISECSRYSGKKYAPECKYCQRGGAQWSFLITQTPGGQWNHQPFENWYLKHSKFKMSGFLFFSDLL